VRVLGFQTCRSDACRLVWWEWFLTSDEQLGVLQSFPPSPSLPPSLAHAQPWELLFMPPLVRWMEVEGEEVAEGWPLEWEDCCWWACWMLKGKGEEEEVVRGCGGGGGGGGRKAGRGCWTGMAV